MGNGSAKGGESEPEGNEKAFKGCVHL
jgi:hypothetical protein